MEDDPLNVNIHKDSLVNNLVVAFVFVQVNELMDS